jgi:hypothetical protein
MAGELRRREEPMFFLLVYRGVNRRALVVDGMALQELQQGKLGRCYFRMVRKRYNQGIMQRPRGIFCVPCNCAFAFPYLPRDTELDYMGKRFVGANILS